MESLQYVTLCKHEFCPLFIRTFLCISISFDVFLLLFSHGKPVWSFVYVFIYCVGAEIPTLMSISDGLEPYFFRRKMEKTQSMKEEMNEEVFNSRQSRHFSFIKNVINVLFPICTLIWRVNSLAKKRYK